MTHLISFKLKYNQINPPEEVEKRDGHPCQSDFHIQRRRGWLSNQSIAASVPMVFYHQKMSLRNLVDDVQHCRFSLGQLPSMIFQGKKRLKVTPLFGAEFYPDLPYLVPEISSLSSLSSFSKGSGTFSFFPMKQRVIPPLFWTMSPYLTAFLKNVMCIISGNPSLNLRSMQYSFRNSL